ncbi:MAG: peptide chain release factor 1 [Aquificota bacterium]|nr:MAG: peptide chain release factor 1 [Aquificota bacterium]
MQELAKTLENLTRFKPDDYMVVNLYLKLGVEERTDRKYLRTYKDMVKEQKEYLERRGLKSHTMESLLEDFKKIEEFLSEPENLKGCKGIGIFSSSARGLFEVVKLPYVYRNRLMVSSDPLIREIAAIDEELGSVGVLLIDRKHVRFFLMNLSGVEEVMDFLEPLATRSHKFHSGGASLKGAQGTMRFSMPARVGGPNMVQHSFGEYRFHMRIQEEKHRLFKIANDALMEAWKEHKFDWLVIGSEREDIREIESHLHTYLLQRLKGYIRVNPSEVKEVELREKVMDLFIQKDREEEKRLVEELVELEGKGLAVNGTSKVLEQLYMGNVKVLLVPESFEKPGYVCANSHLPLLKPECPTEEPVYEVPDVVDEVLEFALEERARIEVIVDPELQKKIDGLACFMRFAL